MIDLRTSLWPDTLARALALPGQEWTVALGLVAAVGGLAALGKIAYDVHRRRGPADSPFLLIAVACSAILALGGAITAGVAWTAPLTTASHLRAALRQPHRDVALDHGVYAVLGWAAAAPRVAFGQQVTSSPDVVYAADVHAECLAAVERALAQEHLAFAGD